MLITILTDELEEEFRESWRMGFVKDPHIDYATNCIHAWFEGREVVLFKFNRFGFINDNRSSSYELSCGRAGILINITLNKSS